MSELASRRTLLVNRLASVLCGDELSSEVWASLDVTAFVARAEQHRVLPLIADQLRHAKDAPPAVLDALDVRVRQHAALDLVREGALRQLVESAAGAGIDLLLFKGSELAYRVYPRPELRTRADSDLLIAEESRQDLHGVLLNLGYEPLAQHDGSLLSYQTAYVLRRSSTKVHEVDVHWRLANPEVFATLPSFDDLWCTAEPLPTLSAHARGLGLTHALLVACVHRVAHHFDSGLLLWFFDVHLLATALPADRWTAFVEAAGHARVAASCKRSLELAARWFNTPIPSEVLDELQRLAEREGEASAKYLSPGRRQVENLLDDLRALPTWSARSRLVLQHLFPSRQYMRDVYGQASHAPLTALYVLRVVKGARKWLVKRRSPAAPA